MMYIANFSPEKKKTFLPKVISPRVHGMLDYGHAAAFLTVGFLCRKNHKAASAAALATGAFVLVQSLLTDYPLGLKPVISFATHGKMDGSFAGISWMLPRILGFSGTPVARMFESNSAVESAIVAMTDFNGSKR